ncbi:MAG: amidohydrolase, partial [Gemmatimonadetes bacterium]|nr:amidohydrolase [Gemmatimonadota bacterium]
MTRVVDFHTHPYLTHDLAPATVEFINRISPAAKEHGQRLGDPVYAAERLAEQGVARAVLLAEHCPRTSGNVRTETVIEWSRRTDGFFLPFACVDPNTDAAPADLLRSYLDSAD